MKLDMGKKDERWKIYVLGALVVGGAIYFFWPDSSGSSNSTSTKNRPAAVPGLLPDSTAEVGVAKRRPNGRVAGDFRPKLRDPRPENRPDLTKIDPTIKLQLLARVQNVALEGGSRNIFQFGVALPVTIAAAGPIPKVKPIIPGPPPAPPKPATPPPSGPPPEPAAPPITFKYYGYSTVKGEPRKRAFFLDGEDVIVVFEGDLIKNRYKVLHVGLRAVDMDDTQYKNGKQSLPLAEDISG